MRRRYYDDYGVRRAAGEIAREVITTGQSSGWCSSRLEDLKEVGEILAPFNITYVDDMHGTWGQV